MHHHIYTKAMLYIGYSQSVTEYGSDKIGTFLWDSYNRQCWLEDSLAALATSLRSALQPQMLASNDLSFDLYSTWGQICIKVWHLSQLPLVPSCLSSQAIPFNNTNVYVISSWHRLLEGSRLAQAHWYHRY